MKSQTSMINESVKKLMQQIKDFRDYDDFGDSHSIKYYQVAIAAMDALCKEVNDKNIHRLEAIKYFKLLTNFALMCERSFSDELNEREEDRLYQEALSKSEGKENG
jgi:hypothetical protein